MNWKEFFKPSLLKILWTINLPLGMLYIGIEIFFKVIKHRIPFPEFLLGILLLIIGYLFGCLFSNFMNAQYITIKNKQKYIGNTTWSIGIILFVLIFLYWTLSILINRGFDISPLISPRCFLRRLN